MIRYILIESVGLPATVLLTLSTVSCCFSGKFEILQAQAGLVTAIFGDTDERWAVR